jgi:hypothetical protein
MAACLLLLLHAELQALLRLVALLHLAGLLPAQGL